MLSIHLDTLCTRYVSTLRLNVEGKKITADGAFFRLSVNVFFQNSIYS